jgi:hypothetical protein
MERLIKDYELLANKYSQVEMLLERKIKENESLIYENDALRKNEKNRNVLVLSGEESKHHRNNKSVDFDDVNRLKGMLRVKFF